MSTIFANHASTQVAQSIWANAEIDSVGSFAVESSAD